LAYPRPSFGHATGHDRYANEKAQEISTLAHDAVLSRHGQDKAERKEDPGGQHAGDRQHFAPAGEAPANEHDRA
jgi:hypothetical protein